MPLTEGTNFSNVFYDFVLNPLKKEIQTEFPGANVYIGEEYKELGTVSIRLFGVSADTEDEWTGEWQKRYTVEIAMYNKFSNNMSESDYKQYYADSERLYQLCFNKKTNTTTVGSTSITWIDGKADVIEYNSLENEEFEVDGLNKAGFDWSCLVSYKA